MPRYGAFEQSNPQPTRGGRYGSGGGRYANPTARAEEFEDPLDPIEIESNPEPDDEEGGWASALGPAALAILGLGGAALARNPMKVATAFNNARITAMLAGWAPIKSSLGNVGAVMNAAVERGSVKPLTEFFRPKTVVDFARNLKSGPVQGSVYGTHQATGPNSWVNLPGRYMSAADEATGAALNRAGMLPEEAAKELLQAPMDPGFAKLYEQGGELAKFVVPFPRIPFNQFKEGLGVLGHLKVPQNAEELRKLALLGGQVGAGYALGSNTEGALPLALGAAAAGRYGIPAIAGQLYGRYANQGNVEHATRSFSPFSDYGFEQSALEPIRPFQRLLERLGIDY